MSTSARKYLEYIDQQVTIAPANSQEELQAANTIAEVFKAHDLDTQVQEFGVSAATPFIRGVLQILLMASILLGGLGAGPLPLVFGVVGVACAIVLTLDSLGHDLIASVTSGARSQNVVAVHRATGDKVVKGARPIVILAHYDTPRESILYNPSLAGFQSIVRKLAFYCAPVCGVVCVIEAFVAGSAFGRVLWLIGILAALPVALLGAAAVAEKFAPCSLGSNDNKASVAAMFDILNAVRPVADDLNGFVPSPAVVDQPQDGPDDDVISQEPPEQPTPKPEPVVVREEVFGTRHGKEIVESLGMLPVDCELDYVEPKIVRVETPASNSVPAAATPVVPASSILAEPVETTEPTGQPLDDAVDVADDEATGDEASQDAYDEQLVGDYPMDDQNGEYIDGSHGIAAFIDVVKDVFEKIATALSGLIAAAQERAAVARQAAADAAAAAAEAKEAAVASEDASTDGESVDDVASDDVEQVSDSDPESESNEELSAEETTKMAPIDDAVSVTGDGDTAGLEAMGTDDPDATRPVPQVVVDEPASPDDPDWGKTDFRPAQSPVSRRAVLFDLPDPSQAEADPLASVSDAPAPRRVPAVPAVDSLPEVDPAPASTDGETVMMPAMPLDDEDTQVSDAPVQHLTVDPLQSATPSQPAKKRGLFGRRKKKDQESMSDWLGVNDTYDARSVGDEIGGWDNFDSEDGWKGGAAVGVQFRVVDDESGQQDGAMEFEVPSEREMREAILHMGDDMLVAHDIWFVALGSSELDHAGTDAFLSDYRTACRGAFVINLDCVGAGELTLLGQEGVHNRRRADRRLVRMLTNTAQDLHIPLSRDMKTNMTTDATAVMRSSMRAVTIAGLNPQGVPALSHTQEDTLDQVDPNQISDVADLVCELIRRS